MRQANGPSTPSCPPRALSFADVLSPHVSQPPPPPSPLPLPPRARVARCTACRTPHGTLHGLSHGPRCAGVSTPLSFPPLGAGAGSGQRGAEWGEGGTAGSCSPQTAPDPLVFPSPRCRSWTRRKGGGMGGGRHCRLMLSPNRPRLNACICACATLNPKPCVCMRVA